MAGKGARDDKGMALRDDKGDCCGVFGVVVLEALDSCPCFRRGDVFSQE